MFLSHSVVGIEPYVFCDLLNIYIKCYRRGNALLLSFQLLSVQFSCSVMSDSL